MSKPIRITADDQPQFPCWLWHRPILKTAWQWTRFLEAPREIMPGALALITHWHTDQPEPPTERPDAHDYTKNPPYLMSQPITTPIQAKFTPANERPAHPNAPTERPEQDYGSNGGVKCDTAKGPCACGAWHETAPSVPAWAVDAAKSIWDRDVSTAEFNEPDDYHIGTIAAIIARHAPDTSRDTEMLDWLEAHPDARLLIAGTSWTATKYARASILAAMRGEKEGL